MFGTAEIHGIEYLSHKSSKWKYSKIKDLKLLTVLGYLPRCNDLGRWNTGHNLCVVFGQEQKEVYDDILLVDNYMPLTIYLMGDYNVKIPVLCAEGNGWGKYEYDEETACLFVYLPSMIFDTKYDTCEYNHPTIK